MVMYLIRHMSDPNYELSVYGSVVANNLPLNYLCKKNIIQPILFSDLDQDFLHYQIHMILMYET